MGNLVILGKIYGEDYMLVRPDMQILSKREILAGLKKHHMIFTNYATMHLAIKSFGNVGVLTTETISRALRDRIECKVHAQQVVIFVKKGNAITINYLQSTNILSNT